MKKLVIGAVVLSLALMTACQKKKEDAPKNEPAKITMNGSTTVQPIAQAVAEVYKDASVSVQGTGSSNGLKALIDGTCDIATSSRQIKPEESQLAATKNVQPKEFEIAKDAIAMVVHPSNPVKELTLQQLQDIYLGKITNWKQVGGPNKDIVLNSRDTSSGTYEVFHEKVMNKQNENDKALRVQSNSAMKTGVAQSEGAIGYLGLGYVDNTVKAVAVNGIVPEAKTALDGTYPIARGLYLYTNGEPKENVKKLIDYFLGPDGQKIVADQGFVPVK